MSLDFQHLRSALELAVRAHYSRLQAELPARDCIGYSLYTDDDVSSIGPVALRASALSVDARDPQYAYYRYGPHEWSEWDDFGLFDDANRILRALYEQKQSFGEYRQKALATAREVLNVLESEGLFGPREADRFVVLWLSDSNDPVMNATAKELNSTETYRAYAAEYE